MGLGKKKAGRKEPLVGLPAALADLRLTPADRVPGGGDDKPKKSTKSSARRKAEEPDDEPPRERKAPAGRGSATRRSKARGGFGLGRLIYWGAVLSLWG